MSSSEAPAPSGDWETLARSASLESMGGDDVELVRELLTFVLAGTPYALPVERVREIVRLREITSIPRVPQWVLGAVALRGEVVQVVDLRLRLGLETAEPSRRSRIIVLHGDDDRVTGILVDGVEQVLRIAEQSISPAASSGESEAVSELCERDGDFISIIDVDRVLELRAD
jgi:purine-binding chemotaxis protein CheW